MFQGSVARDIRRFHLTTRNMHYQPQQANPLKQTRQSSGSVILLRLFQTIAALITVLKNRNYSHDQKQQYKHKSCQFGFGFAFERIYGKGKWEGYGRPHPPRNVTFICLYNGLLLHCGFCS